MKGRNVLACLAVILMAAPAFMPFSGAIYLGPRVKIDIGDTTLNERAATTVLVTVYNETGVLVPGATVNILAEAGTFDQGTKTTGATGMASFIYTAPSVVLEQRMVNITATAVYDLPPYTEATKTIWLMPVPKVYVEGPDQVVKGGEAVRYTVRAATGSEPLTGGVLNVTPPLLGTIVQNQQATDGTGRAWFDYRPPTSGTGETVLTVSVTPPMMVEPVYGSKTIQVVDEITTMTISVAADKDPVPCWGSSNLTATVRKGNQTVAGATVEWTVTRGWKSASSTVTDATGRSRIQYTATNATGQLWAGTVTVIARATSGADRADTNMTFDVSPLAVAWTAEFGYSSTGGQLFPGDKLTVELSLRLRTGIPWQFITPVSVDLRFWTGTGTMLYNQTLGRDISIVPGLDWKSGPVDLLTVPASPTEFQYRWQVRVRSEAFGYVYYELPAPVQVRVLAVERGSWTFLEFISDSNNLWKFIGQHLNRLEEGGPEGEFRYLVEESGGIGHTYREELDRDMDEDNLNLTILDDLGELDMGDPDTLLDFLVWGATLAPAENYCIIIYDHGGGWYGVCTDDYEDPATHIDPLELEDCLKQFGARARKPQLLIFETCLMSAAESFYRLQGEVNYILSSESIILTDYDLITARGLRRILSHYPPSPEQACLDLMEGFREWAHRQYPMGVVRMDAADEFITSIDTMCDRLLEKWAALGGLVSEAKSGTIWMSELGSIDLKTFLETLRMLILDYPMSYRYLAVVTAIEDVLARMDALFLDRHIEGNAAEDGVGGVNIFFPYTSGFYRLARNDYLATCFPADFGWTRMLEALNMPPAGSGGGFHAQPPVPGLMQDPLQQLTASITDSDSDGLIESVTGGLQADNSGNGIGFNVVVDTIPFNNSRGAQMPDLAFRQVFSLPAGARLDRTLALTSPVEDLVQIIVTVVALDGTVVESRELGRFMMEASPRTGSVPVLNITASEPSPMEGKSVTFSAVVSDPDGKPVEVWWDFDDRNGQGLDAAGASANRSYRGTGNRIVTCIASDGTHVTVSQLTVNVTANTANRRPMANLTYAFTNATAVVFNASGSTDPDGDRLEYLFLYGDGTPAAWSSSPGASRVFANGTYECVVMVRDGCRYNGSSAIVNFTVTGQAPPPPPPANRAPAARFVVISNLMGAKKPINFDASISSDPDNDTLQYRFDWGDGNATDWSGSKTASHTYSMPGTYNVTITVRDAGNLTSTNTTKIVVKPAPKTVAPPKGFIPGPGLAAVVTVFAIAGAMRRLRKQAGHRTE